jgi:hypothetical protein
MLIYFVHFGVSIMNDGMDNSYYGVSLYESYCLSFFCGIEILMHVLDF